MDLAKVTGFSYWEEGKEKEREMAPPPGRTYG